MKKLLVCLFVGLSARLAYCDTKISAMISTTTLNSVDIIPVVTNPGTSPANRTITKSNLITTLGVPASGSYIQNTASLQSGATFYTSSGTATNFNATKVQAGTMIGTLAPFGTIAAHDPQNGSGAIEIMASTITDTANTISFQDSAFNLVYIGEEVKANQTYSGTSVGDAYWYGNGKFYLGNHTGTPVLKLDSSNGNVNVPILSASQFVQTDGSNNLVSYDLLNSTQTFTGGNTFSSATFTRVNGVVPGLVAGTNITSITGSWPNQTINAATQGGGGSSSLAVTTGTSSGFSWTASSPTAVINFSSVTFTAALQGSATAFIGLNPSSVTLQGTITAASLGALTGNQSITWTGSGDVSGNSSGSTSISPTLTLASTQTHITQINPSGLLSLGGSGQSVQISSNAIIGNATHYANGSFVTPSSVTANGWVGGGLSSCGSSSQALSYTSTSGQYGCTTITAAGIGALTGNQSITISGDSSGTGTTAITLVSASTQTKITQINPSGTLSLGSSGNTVIIASNTVVPGTTFYADGSIANSYLTISSTGTIQTLGNLNISSGIYANGSAGTNGQFLTSGGPGTKPSWTSGNSGTITSVIAGTGLTGGGSSGSVTLAIASTAAFTTSTQTFTAQQTFSSATISNSLTIPSGTSPTVDALGKIGFDTTAGQLLANDGSTTSVVGVSTRSFTVTISSGIGWNGLKLPIWRAPVNASVTITEILAESLPNSTTVQYALGESAFGSINVSSSSIFSVAYSTANNTGVTTTSFNDNSIASQASISLYTPSSGAATGTPDSMTLTIYYKQDRQ